jgi:hypothetical protein
MNAVGICHIYSFIGGNANINSAHLRREKNRRMDPGLEAIPTAVIHTQLRGCTAVEFREILRDVKHGSHVRKR